MLKMVPFLALLITALTVHAEDNTDCHDPGAKAFRQTLLDKYPNDADLKVFFELRERLCEQVLDGRIDIGEASTRFEQARERLRLKWEEQNRARGLAAGGAG